MDLKMKPEQMQTSPLPKGFAAMTDKARQRKIAARGGRKVSRNRAHMARIGSAGGSSTWARIKASQGAAK